MKRSAKRPSRYSLRTLMMVVALVGVICWFVPRWGVILVNVRADRVLIPLGIATYGHSPQDEWIIRESEIKAEAIGEAHRAVWISEKNCRSCHSGVSGLLAFPPPDRGGAILSP